MWQPLLSPCSVLFLFYKMLQHKKQELHNKLKLETNQKPPYMFTSRIHLWTIAIRSHRAGWTSCPALLGELDDHGSQLWRVSADGGISDGWSNGANTQHQVAAITVGGRKALVSQAWLRARTFTVGRICSRTSVVLTKRRYLTLASSQDVEHFCDALCVFVSKLGNKSHCSTSLVHGCGLGSPLGDTLSPGASRVWSKSSARRGDLACQERFMRNILKCARNKKKKLS